MPPIKQRYQNLDDAEKKELLGFEVAHLDTQVRGVLDGQLGLQLEADKKVPVSNNYPPRIFIMGTDEKGHDFPRDINGTGIVPGSPEFFEQVQLGNVFVYPAGEANPVQLQITRQKRGLELSFSDPVPPEQIPAPPVRPMTRWQSFWNKISGGFFYKRKAAAIKQAGTDHANVKQKLRENAEARAAVLERERQELAARRERERKANFMKELASEESEIKKEAIGMENFVNVFKPVPKKQLTQYKFDKDHALSLKYGLYKEQDFRDLTILTDDVERTKQELKEKDAELSAAIQKEIEEKKKRDGEKNARQNQNDGPNAAGNKQPEKKPDETTHPDQLAKGKPYKFMTFRKNDVKPGGVPLTDAQFSAVALSACWQTKNLVSSSMADVANYDPTLKDALRKCGYLEEDLDALRTYYERSMGTTDCFLTIPRDSEGIRFGRLVDKGRVEAAEAFEKYRQGDKEPLARLLAHGVNVFAGEFSQHESDRLGVQTKGCILAGEELLKLMEQDPELEAKAREQGMKEERLVTLKGMIKFKELENDSTLAVYKLAKARVDGVELSKEEKGALARQIVLSKLANMQLRKHNHDIEADQNSAVNKLNSADVFVEDPMKNGMPLPKSEWGEVPPPAGKIYVGSTSAAQMGVRLLYDPLPKIAAQLNEPKQCQKLEQLADQIVRQEGLDALSNDELYKLLNYRESRLKLSECLERAEKQSSLKQVPDKQNELATEEKKITDPIQSKGTDVRQSSGLIN